MASSNPIPVLLAILVCDTVIIDAGTQKKTLVGIFDRVSSPQLPVVVGRLGLYAKMVEGSGKYKMKLRLANLRDESPVMEMGFDADWQRPEAPLELAFNLSGIPLPEYGSYEIQLFADEVYLGRAVIQALKLEVPPTGRG